MGGDSPAEPVLMDSKRLPIKSMVQLVPPDAAPWVRGVALGGACLWVQIYE